MQKTYQAIEFVTFDTYVTVDGKQVLVEFRGGNLEPRRNGIFTTTDPKLIKALDADSGNGKSFKCIQTVGDEPEKDKPEKDKPEVTTETGDDGIEQVKGIKTVQEAKEYLFEKFPGEAKPSQITNGAKVKEFAAENKIKFVDLP